ncbi:MAG: hypothetical protein RL009_297 [Actinomycetota bacterium]|mgnify:CR=1 FL=1|jgi:4-diphosphocytidyl-2-C-methyl-D-erythritol kinase
MRRVVASAPAKVNLHFGVGPLLADGYHSVSSLYQALDLREEVGIRTSQTDEWSIGVTGSITPEQIALVPTDDTNLVVKAALLAARLADFKQLRPLEFDIVKRIPVAGGMAGGSADAAAALLAAANKFNLEMSRDELERVAVELGADVPFALHGGTALGTGRGEELRRLNLATELHFVMISADAGLKTPSVYGRLDAQREQVGFDPRAIEEPQVPSELIAALEAGDVDRIATLIHNDLEPAALELMPELELTIAAAHHFGALRAFVSGSGPTIAALATDADQANELAQRLRDANFVATQAATTKRGAELLGE